MTAEERAASHKTSMDELRARSGTVQINSKLVSFLYELLRDHVPVSVVEGIMLETTDPDVVYTNGWLAEYAEDVARRLGDDPKRVR